MSEDNRGLVSADLKTRKRVASEDEKTYYGSVRDKKE